MSSPEPVKGWLFRENKGWVYVTKQKVMEDGAERITEWWKTVSDLPLAIFPETDLLLSDDGSVVVKEVSFSE